MKWSFSYISFVKLSLITQSIHVDPKLSIIKGQHCICMTILKNIDDVKKSVQRQKKQHFIEFH